MKRTIGDGRVLGARIPAELDQEIYAPLVAYQALCIADATLRWPDVDIYRGSVTIALNAPRPDR